MLDVISSETMFQGLMEAIANEIECFSDYLNRAHIKQAVVLATYFMAYTSGMLHKIARTTVLHGYP